MPSVRRSDLWKEDGNVVLQAGNTQFRVHRSMLADHSPVFKDIFASSFSSHIRDRYFSVSEPQSLSTVSALLSLGDKYDMKVPRRDALRVLHAGSPLTLSAAPPASMLLPGVTQNYPSAICFDLVNVLSENNVETLLPIALLNLHDRNSSYLHLVGIQHEARA